MLLTALISAVLLTPAHSSPREGFESSLGELRDNLRSSARAVGAQVLKRPHAATLRTAQGVHGRRSGDPCLENNRPRARPAWRP